MEITTNTQAPGTDPATNRLFRSIILSLLVYPLSLFIPIKIPLTLLEGVINVYESIGAAPSGLTLFAMRFLGFLAQHGFTLAMTVGPILACIHVVLRTDAPRQRRFVRTFAAVLILTTSALVFALFLPLITA